MVSGEHALALVAGWVVGMMHMRALKAAEIERLTAYVLRHPPTVVDEDATAVADAEDGQAA